MDSRKAPSSEGNLNKDLCEFLLELAAYERNVSRNVFKSNAYRSAASALAAYPTRIKSGKEAANIKGIGKKIAEKIDEFLATGKLKKLEKIRVDEVSISLAELTRVSGIGPAKARQLYDQGIKTIKQLEEHKELLTHHQLLGLKYYKDFEERIPRQEVEKIEKAVSESLAKIYDKWIITVCGSFRRGSEKSGDIDILLTYKEGELSAMLKQTSNSDKKRKLDESSESSPSKKSKLSPSTSSTNSDLPPTVNKTEHRIVLQRVVNRLTESNIVTDTLSLGDTKFMGVCKLKDSPYYRRIDIRLLSPHHYYCGVLYFTGSDLFNKDMRAKALDAGFTLNEYSLRPMGSTLVPGEPLPISSEEDVFDYIGMKFKKPTERNM